MLKALLKPQYVNCVTARYKKMTAFGGAYPRVR